MKLHRRSKKRRQKRKISPMERLIFSILGIVLLGDIVGAIMYLRQSPDVQADLMAYVATGNALSFFQIFWRQFLYQLTIWLMGLTLIGNVVNLFLIFVRGVSAGFNLAVLIREIGIASGAGVILLWLMQYILILFTTILSVYFSFRFAYFMIKCLMKKKYNLIKKHIKGYARQFVVLMVLTLFSAMLSAVTTPRIQQQLARHVFSVETSE
ncbi:MAG: stage II sporulation protein M [Defluviitaleaceae bacterium]|nr:stage II sporulation protein M [Defluviitaleaceae bacterium]